MLPPNRPRAKIPPPRPSEWRPVPIPEPAEALHTADPETPTLRQLAERERQRQAALAQAPAWLELAYRHPDDESPMAGAPYRVRFADGSLREGALDAYGRARLDGLSPALAGTGVDVTFGDPTRPYRALPVPAVPNPDYVGAAGFDRLIAPTTQVASLGGLDGIPLPLFPWVGVPSDPREVGDFVWAVIAGAYKKDPTTGQLLGQMIVAFIPVVGQIGAVRDASAYVYRLTRPNITREEKLEAWVGLVLSLLVLVPEIGAALAGVLRLAQRGGRVVEHVPFEAILRVLNRVGRGNAFAFAKKYLTYEAVQARAVFEFKRLMETLDTIFARIVGNPHGLVPQPVVAAAGEIRTALAPIRAEGEQAVRGAVRSLVTPIEQAVRRAELHLMERDAASGATNGRVEARAGAADPPAHGGVADETFGSSGGRGTASATREFSPAQREMIAEMRRAGVKFDEAKLVDVRRMPDGRVVFLEQGGPDAGLQHILDAHAGDFVRKGVPQSRVADLLMDTLERGRVVGYQGKGTSRPIYEAIIDGHPQPIAITTSSNGYIVGANPRSIP